MSGEKPARQRKPVTARQQSRFLRAIIIISIAAVLWFLLAPGGGLISYLKKKQEVHRLEGDINALEAENKSLQQEVDRLHKDDLYLEKIAREELGLLKENEKVFDFSRPETQDK